MKILRSSPALLASLAAVALTACNQSATSETKAAKTTVPEVAHTRADIESIVRAYLLEHPEVILEAMDVLTERDNAAAALELASDPRDVTLGAADAPVTIVEFFDYNCGYCKASVDWVFRKVNNSDGKVRVIFKELPILSNQSHEAALAAFAAKKQDKYLDFHRKLMEQKAHTLSTEQIDKLANEVGLNVTRMRKDMEDAAAAAYLQDVRAQAIKYGATATPSFIVNGKLIEGFDQDGLEKRIQEVLAES